MKIEQTRTKVKTMKVFTIKTSDFINLQKVEKITDKNTLEQVEQVEKITGEKIIKNLNKGKNSVLMIGEQGNYYITARPCYIQSLVNILEQVGIESDKIIQLKKSTDKTSVLSLEQVKNIIAQ